MEARIRIIPAGTEYRYSGSNLENFAGNFSHKECRNSEYTIFTPDSFDQDLCKNIKLKEGEKIFRCSTERSRRMQISYFVKININKGLIYFNLAGVFTENVIFDSKGTKVTFLNIVNN